MRNSTSLPIRVVFDNSSFVVRDALWGRLWGEGGVGLPPKVGGPLGGERILGMVIVCLVVRTWTHQNPHRCSFGLGEDIAVWLRLGVKICGGWGRAEDGGEKSRS